MGSSGLFNKEVSLPSARVLGTHTFFFSFFYNLRRSSIIYFIKLNWLVNDSRYNGAHKNECEFIRNMQADRYIIASWIIEGARERSLDCNT